MGLSFLIRCPLELIDLLFVCDCRFAECLSFLIRYPLELIDLLFVCDCRFAERLSSLHMNALTWETFQNHRGNPTPQEGMRLDICNSEFAREPLVMKTFMRQVSY